MAYPADSQFTPLTRGGTPYGGVPGDENPGPVDLLGNASFPSAYVAYDGTTLYVRLRVHKDPRHWQKTGFQNIARGLLINTDGGSGTYQWMLAVPGLRNRIALVLNTIIEVNPWTDTAEGAPIIHVDVARVRLTGTSSSFGGNPAYFIDLVMPASSFFSTLSVTSATALRFLPFTAAIDSLTINEGLSFTNAFSDPISIAASDVRAKLDIDKQLTAGPASVTTGQIGQWSASIAVTNSGKSQANAVVANDLIELDQVTAFTVHAASTGSIVYNPLTKVLSWTIGNLFAGATATLTFTVSGFFANATGGTRRLNTATVSGVDSFLGGQISPVRDHLFITVHATGSVAGIMLDQSTHFPVSGADVRLYDLDNVLVGQTTADVDGAYSFAGLAPATYSVVVTEPFFEQKIQFITILSGQTTQADILLAPVPGSVNGTVTTASAEPIAGAMVKLVNSAGATVGQTLTNADGAYPFAAVFPGTYTVTVSADTYRSDTAGVVVCRGQPTIHNVMLQPSPSQVAGMVRSEGSAPIPDALVEVLNQSGIPVTQTVSDGAGQYTMNKLAPGDYRLRASAPGYSTQLAGVSLSSVQAAVADFVLPAGNGSVSGTVADAQMPDDGIPQASVKVLTPSGISAAETLTEANGDYALSSLAPGSYVLNVVAEGYGNKSVGVVVAPGRDTQVDVQLEKLAGVISGTVTDLFGNPLAGAVVSAWRGAIPVTQAITDGQGGFTFPHLAPGIFSVIASAHGSAVQVLGATVLTKQVSNLSFSLQAPPGSLAGHVTDSDNQPITGAIVTVRENSVSGQVVASVLTDGNGDYTVRNLALQSYVVVIFAPDKAAFVAEANVHATVTTTVHAQLAALPGSLAGAIVDATTGLPVAGAVIEARVRNSAGVIVASACSDSAGGYVIDGIAPGDYTVTAQAADYQTNSASAAVSANDAATVSLALVPSPGEVIGQIVTQDTQQPIAGAHVNAYDANGALIDSERSDSQGSFQIMGLTPGPYVIAASASGFQTCQTGATVLADTVTPLHIQLAQNLGTISGTVSPIVPGTALPVPLAGAATSGQTASTKIGRLPLAGDISGMVLLPDGTQAAVNNVQLSPSDANHIRLQSVLAQPDGTFHFPDVAPGTYSVIGEIPGVGSGSEQAVVVENQTTFVVIRLQAAGSIQGTVRSAATGQSIAGAVVYVQSSNRQVGMAATVPTDQEGRYHAGLAPGSYIVVISAAGFAAGVASTTVETGETGTLDFLLNPSLAIGYLRVSRC